MQLRYDLARRVIERVDTSAPAALTVSHAEPIQVDLAEDFAAAELGADAALRAIIKQRSHTDDDPLALVVLTADDVDANAANRYRGVLDTLTAAVAAALEIGEEGDDITQLNCVLEIQHRATGEADWIPSLTKLEILLLNTYGQDDDAAPLTVHYGAVQYLRSVVGLTGGGATKLDGLATADLAAGAAVCLFDDSSSGAFRVYEMVAGTDAESAPDVIRPDDYHASTNAKVWKLRSASGGGTWGSITGTLSAQTDLQAALDAKVASTRAVNTSGLAGGGGSLASDRTIDVPIASQAEAEAGASNAKAMTPLRTAQAIAALGGGGSAALVRGSGLLKGYTVAGSSATSGHQMHQFGSTSDTVISVTIDGGTPVLFAFAAIDPMDGSVWVNTSGVISPNDMAGAFQSALGSQGIGFSAPASDVTDVVSPTTGASSTVAMTDTGGNTVSSAVPGEDEVAPSGHVTEVELLAAVTGEKIKLVACGLMLAAGGGVTVAMDVALKHSGVYTPLAVHASLASGQVVLVPQTLDALNGKATGESLVARITGSVAGSPTGGEVRAWAVAEQAA